MNSARTNGTITQTSLALFVTLPITTALLVFPLFVLPAQPLLSAVLPFSLLLMLASMLWVSGVLHGNPWTVSGLLIFVIFGLSLSLRTRDYGETSLDWQNGLKLSTWALVIAIGIFRAKQLARRFVDPAVILAALFGIFALLSAHWSMTSAYTAANAAGLIAYLMLACLAIGTLGTEATLRLVLKTLMCFLALALLAGIVLPDRAWLEPSDFSSDYRLRGLSGHPNVLGEQAALLITVAIICYRRSSVGTFAAAVALLLGTGVLLAAGSRTMLAATLTSWLLVALRERRLLLIASLLLLSAFVSSMAVINSGLVADVASSLGGLSRSGSSAEVVTLTGRTDLWLVAVDLVMRQPLLGWGYNGTEALLVGSVGRGFLGDPVNAHNMYLQLLLSLGLIGSLPVFTLFGLLIVRMIRRPSPMRDQLVLLVLLTGLTEVSISATPGLLVLVFFLAIAADAGNAEARATHQTVGAT